MQPKTKKVYISGPITGRPEEAYKTEFADAAETIKAWGTEFIPVNPVEITAHLPAGSAWEEYMAVCVEALKDCAAVYILPNWHLSAGARVEVQHAVELNLGLLYAKGATVTYAQISSEYETEKAEILKAASTPANSDGHFSVLRLIDADEAQNKPEALGGTGGFFDDGMRWEDYIQQLNYYGALNLEYLNPLRDFIIANKIWIGGDEHQALKIPLFNDGTIALYSFRAWGDLLAAIWSTELKRDYNYMDFYIGCRMAEPPAEWNK